MTTPTDSDKSITGSERNPGGRWLYPLLLAFQTSGVIVMYWERLPVLRQLIQDGAVFAIPETPVWSLVAVALIQVGYWVGYRLRPTQPTYVNPLLGHFVLFVARLVFLLGSAAFSLLFIVNTPSDAIPVFRYLLLLTMLFSLFCYTLELERLGKSLLA
jgi:hypothetical protein